MGERDDGEREQVPEAPEGAGGESGGLVPVPDPVAELEEARAELATLRDRCLRAQAEFENYRKRHQREREEVNRRAKERFLAEIPGVLDNLERALRHAAAPGAAPEALAQGVELVARQLQEILARHGATPMQALGAVFDPHLHEAMARVETTGTPPDGTVVEEFRRGWLLDGKVLRAALVSVAKATGDDPVGGEP